MAWVNIYREHLLCNYIEPMHIDIEEADEKYINEVEKLRDLVKYGSSVNRRLVEIFAKYTGEVVEQKSCCASERKIFLNQFMAWHNSLSK